MATALDFLASMLASDLLFGNPTAPLPPTSAAANHVASSSVDASSASSASAPTSKASLQSNLSQSQSAAVSGSQAKNASAAKPGDVANAAGGVRQRHAIFGSQTAASPATTVSDKLADKASAGDKSSKGANASASAFSSAASASASASSTATPSSSATDAAVSESRPPLSSAFTAAWGDAAFDSTVAALLLEQIATLADTDATHRALAAVRIGAAAEVGRHWDWDASTFAESGLKTNEAADGGNDDGGGSNAAVNGGNHTSTDAAKGVDSILDFDANESDADCESNQLAHSSAAKADDNVSESVPHPLVAAAPGFLASLRQRVGYMFRCVVSFCTLRIFTFLFFVSTYARTFDSINALMYFALLRLLSRILRLRSAVIAC